MKLYINHSKALKHFKKVLGNANHFLITALVGLDALQENEDYKISEDFHTSWNPQNKLNSINRTRKFILEMSLSRAVDALEIYIDHSNNAPFLFQSESLKQGIKDNSKSITKKFNFICDEYKIDSKLHALGILLITWRNRIIHSECDNQLEQVYKKIILDNSQWLCDNFRHLDATKLLEHFEKKDGLTFKEATSLIKVTHDIVYFIEGKSLSNIDSSLYFKEIIKEIIKNESKNDNQKLKNIAKVWGKNGNNKIRAINGKLSSYGLSEQKSDSGVEIDEFLVSEVYKTSPKELLENYS